MILIGKPCCPLLKGDVENTGALSPSSSKYCCTVTQIFRLLYVFCTPGGSLLVSLQKQQFAGVHGAVPGIRPFSHTSWPIQPVDLRWHHSLGAWSKVFTFMIWTHSVAMIWIFCALGAHQSCVPVCWVVRSRANRESRGGRLALMRS